LALEPDCDAECALVVEVADEFEVLAVTTFVGLAFGVLFDSLVVRFESVDEAGRNSNALLSIQYRKPVFSDDVSNLTPSPNS